MILAVEDGGEGAKFWLQLLTEIKNRGAEDVCIVVCDGLKGLPESIEATWPLAVVQTCVLHLIRHTFRLASRRDWDAMARDLRSVYTAPSEHAAKERLAEFNEVWGQQYPAVARLWENSWTEFAPFLDCSPEIRRVIYPSTGSSRCTPACAERPGPGATSPTSGPRSSACTWPCEASTPPEMVEGGGCPGTPTDQVHVESFYSRLKADWPHLTGIRDPPSTPSWPAGASNTTPSDCTLASATSPRQTSATDADWRSAAPAPQASNKHDRTA